MQTTTTDRRRLGLGLALSLMAHAAVVGYAGSALLPVPAQSAGAPVLLVSLRRAEPVPPQPEPSEPAVKPERSEPVAAPRRPAVKTRAASVPVPDASVAPIAPMESVPAARSETVRPAPTPPPAAPSMETVRTRILGEVRQRLAEHFRYPLLARRRGWEGEVLLGFTVDGSGRIADVHIARSSGHTALDDAARTALERVGHITAPAQRPTALELPVIYRLEG